MKRLLALLVLLALGFLGLRLALGGESFGTLIGTKQEPGPQERPKEQRPGVALGSGQGGTDEKPVKISIAGAGKLPKKREVALADGKSLLMNEYEIVYEDSAPLGEDRYRLSRVQVRFYKLGGTATAPVALLTSVLKSAEMLVTLGRDDKGNAALREDKDMEFFDAALTTTEHGQPKNLELRLAHAKARSDASGTRISTFGDEDPFTLQIAGDRPLALTGRGLAAFLPAAGGDGRRTGSLDLRVVNDPKLTAVTARSTTTAQARGPLHYVEDLASGDATVDMRNGVVFTDRGATEQVARGDTLLGSLRRSKDADTSKVTAAWTRITLTGQPAQIDADGNSVRCDRLVVLPGLGHEPAWILARGKGTQLVRKEPDGSVSTFTAERGIRVLRVRPWLEPYMPRLGPAFGELVELEGRTTLEQAELKLAASEGMRILRGKAVLDRPALTTVVGHGVVDVQRGTLALAGDEGFFLWLRGDQGEITLASNAGKASVTLAEGALTALRTLRAGFRGGALDTCVETGAAVRLVAKTARETIEGTADRVESRDGSAFDLHGEPASVVRDGGGRLSGRLVRVTRYSERATGLFAQGGAQLFVERVEERAVEPVDLRARQIEMVPFVVSMQQAAWHGGALPRAARALFARGLLTPWLDARDDVRFSQKGKQGQEDATGHGSRLWLRVTAPEGLLLGSPAIVVAKDKSGRTNLGQAPRIRFRKVGDQTRAVLEPEGEDLPRFLVRGAAMPGGQTGTRLEIRSAAPVAIDEVQIVFPAAVLVRSLLPDDEPDPNGFQMVAKSMTLDRDERSGDVKKLIARGAVQMHSPRLQARGEEVVLTPDTGWCQLRGDAVPARVVFAGGFVLTGSHLQANYLTGEGRVWHGNLSGAER